MGAWYAPSRFLRLPWLIPTTENAVVVTLPFPLKERGGRTFDGHRSINEPNESGRDTNKVRSATVRSTGIARNIGTQATADHQDRFLPDQTKAIHGVDDTQHRLHRLVLLSASHDEGGEKDVVMLEVRLPSRSIERVYNGICNKENSTPRLINLGEMVMFG